MRVAIYLRVSTQDQSTELQHHEITAFVDSRGWQTFCVYEDKLTGTTNKRPALQDLMSAVRNRKVDVVVCWKLDRLFRSLADLVSTLRELEELGVTFISLKDQIDMTTASGRLMTHLLGAFAEFEASLIRERVRAGLLNARRKGVALGRPKTIDTARAVDLRRSGMSLAEIANELGVTKSAVSKTLSKAAREEVEITSLPRSKIAVE